MSTSAVTKYPGTTAATAYKSWDNFTPTRLGADDASYASAYLTYGTPLNSYTDVNSISNFGFSLPADAVITKLKVTAKAYASGSKCYLDTSPAGVMPLAYGLDTSPTVYSASRTTSMPTAASLNASTYALDVYAYSQEVVRTVYLDYINLEATYYIPPTATTAAITDVTAETASGGGNATDDGSGTVSAKGVCWSSTNPPTIADSKTTNGSGTGSFTSSLTGLFPSTRYYVRAYATTEDGTAYGPVVAFDTLGSSTRSLVARPFTTRALAAELVARQSDGIVDWWLENYVARAELRPLTSADIPRSRWYVVSHDTPGATVALVMDSEDTPDIVCVVYRTYGVANVRDGSIRSAYYPDAPTSAIQRVDLVDTTSQYMSDTDAATYAQNVWLRTNAEAMSSTITAIGGLLTVDGRYRAAPLILAGDWIDVIDLHGHVPVYITGSTYSQEQNMVTITTGSREQGDLVIPGRSALPAELKAYNDGGASGGGGGGVSSGGGSAEKGAIREFSGGGQPTGRPSTKAGWMWVDAGAARVTHIDGVPIADIPGTDEGGWVDQGEILVPIPGYEWDMEDPNKPAGYRPT